MGFNTVAVLYNDHTDDIRKSGRVGERIADAMRDYHSPHALDRNFGAGVIISQDHADGEQVVVVHGNTGQRVEDASDLGWRALDAMKECLERHGYTVKKRSRNLLLPAAQGVR